MGFAILRVAKGESGVGIDIHMSKTQGRRDSTARRDFRYVVHFNDEVKVRMR